MDSFGHDPPPLRLAGRTLEFVFDEQLIAADYATSRGMSRRGQHQPGGVVTLYAVRHEKRAVYRAGIVEGESCAARRVGGQARRRRPVRDINLAGSFVVDCRDLRESCADMSVEVVGLRRVGVAIQADIPVGIGRSTVQDDIVEVVKARNGYAVEMPPLLDDLAATAKFIVKNTVTVDNVFGRKDDLLHD